MSEEIVKKPKASAKPRAATSKAAAPVKAAPKKVVAKKVAAPVESVAAVPTAAPAHHEIARLAERFWIERGWQDGFAEQDWLRAEQELRTS
jgi:Protein of unknown function (DUF2934)